MVRVLQPDLGTHRSPNSEANHMGTVHKTHPFPDTRSNTHSPNLDADTRSNRQPQCHSNCETDDV